MAYYDPVFYAGKRVFVTGHTGFKGSWLCKMLVMAGAQVTGYSLEPPTNPNLFSISGVEGQIRSVIGDIRDFAALQQAYNEAKPEIVLHLAAQPIVRDSYKDPRYTYETNVMGTVNLLECVRQAAAAGYGPRSVLNVTTDKVYHNNEWAWGYRENEPLDGFDPYSNSKSCSELVTHSYINSFFADGAVRISTARAGNVIGGGDVISTYPDQEYVLPDPAPFAPAGQSFVGWKVWVNDEPMYDGEFTFNALSQLLDSGFYGEEAWLTFQAVYADDYRVIHLKFVDEDENVIGGGDVISTYPDQEYVLPDPAPFAPAGQSFVGWKVWVNDEPMYDGEFTFNALSQLLDSGFYGEEAWLTFQAVYADVSDADTYTLTYDANYSGGGDEDYDYEVGEDGSVRVTVEENMFRRSGYTFTGWNTRANGNGTDYEEGDRLTLTGDLTLYAQWRKNGSTGTDTTSYTIDASASRGGDISPSGRVFVARGNDRTFRITADEGYVIDDVRVDGESVGAVRTYTFENVRRDHTIEVIFVPDGQQTVVYGPDDTGVSDWLNVDDHVSYLNGYPGGLFGPNDNMTRAEVAQMFYNLLLNQNVTVTVSFADVSADAWYAQAVNALASLGIVQGVGDGMFAPERTITRAEFTVIAMRFAELPTGGTNPFSDVRTSDWFYAQVVGAAQYGWITGYTNGTFGPNNTITRAEVTAIVNRMLSRSADEDFVDDNAAELVRFNDVSDTYWAYYDIMEATNSHEYEWDNNAEEWTDLA